MRETGKPKAISRIGVPRALMFYRYYPFLKTLLEGFGYEVVASPPTNLRIMGMGTDLCVDDVCVAVKALFGHVRYLEEEVDAVLIPRLVSVEKRDYDTFTCPKLIAAPDMVRFSFPHLPPPLEFVVDVGRAPWWWGCVRLGRKLGVPLRGIARAYAAAVREQRRFEDLQYQGLLPADALKRMENGNGGLFPGYASEDRDVAVAVVGHPYLLGDPLVNKRLVHWLDSSGARVLASTMLTPRELEREARRLPDLSWSYERELLAAASHFMEREGVDGIIYLTSFGCGPDSLVTEMVRREVPNPHGRALLDMVLDEHSAESGVRTRAEAFVDLLRHRKRSRSRAVTA
ncbi:MAG: acyl-CoA dehydratase activase-related protein [Actinomycetota bacterium]|nr:acyl-CoA dehydratase activase-related protein [Actinomycetota bacterium]